jgi:hypothetical protein
MVRMVEMGGGLNMSIEWHFLLSKNANNTSSDFVMRYGLVIFAGNVDTNS